MRNGKARIANSAIACTSSPVVMSPVDTRQAPSQSRSDGAEVREGVEARLEPGPQPADDQPLAAQLLGPLPHPLDLAALEAERLHEQRALEALVGHARHVADAGLGGGGRLLDALRVGVVEQGQPREQRDGDAEEHPVDGGEQHHRDAR